jgi:hypothetical protein
MARDRSRKPKGQVAKICPTPREQIPPYLISSTTPEATTRITSDAVTMRTILILVTTFSPYLSGLYLNPIQQSACRANRDTLPATRTVAPRESRGANTDNAFSKEYRSDKSPGASLSAFVAPDAKGKEFLLRQSSRWSNELVFWL